MIEREQEFKVLDKGFIRVVDWLGSDDSICDAARISYGKGTRSVSDNRNLIRYLMRHRHCYSGDMEVLTIDGWKKWKNCFAFETFLIPDPKTHKLIPEFLATYKFDNPNGKMYNFSNNRMSYSVTDGHRMYFKKKYAKEYDVYKVENMAKWGHFESGSKYTLIENSDRKTEFFQFIGFYLGDGSKCGKKKVSFHLLKDRKKVYLEKLLRILNWKYSKRPSSSKINANFYIIEPSEYFYKYVDTNLTTEFKKLNEGIENLYESDLRGLWDGLINSDGSIKKDREQIEFSSKSIKLIELFELLGTIQGIDTHRCKSFENIHSSKAYLGDKTTLEARKQYFSNSITSDSVYCATSSTGLLLVRGSEDTFSFVCGNTSPTEMCELIIHVKAPIYVFRQWHRHRMASLNEYSGRYSEMIDECEETSPNAWRTQSTTNKQGSEGSLESMGHVLSETEKDFLKFSRNVYEQRLKMGVAKEQARKDLPVSNYSEMVWKSDLHNLLHFLSLRMDSHAQKEIRDYATIIGDKIVAELWPVTWSAFQDYRLNAITLTTLDITMIAEINGLNGNIMESINGGPIQLAIKHGWLNEDKPLKIKSVREREEFEVKATKLGIEIPWL